MFGVRCTFTLSSCGHLTSLHFAPVRLCMWSYFFPHNMVRSPFNANGQSPIPPSLTTTQRQQDEIGLHMIPSYTPFEQYLLWLDVLHRDSGVGMLVEVQHTYMPAYVHKVISLADLVRHEKTLKYSHQFPVAKTNLR